MTAATATRTHIGALITAAERTPQTLSCLQLAEIVRHAADLSDHGISTEKLRAISRVYARRLDQLGPDEFDRRTLIGA